MQVVRRSVLTLIVMAIVASGTGCSIVHGKLAERRAENERAAINSLRTLNTALLAHRQAGAAEFPKTLQPISGVDAALACGQPECLKSGYSFRYEAVTDATGPKYMIVARPNKYENTGVQSFYSDESGVIRGTRENRAAAKTDAPVS